MIWSADGKLCFVALGSGAIDVRICLLPAAALLMLSCMLAHSCTLEWTCMQANGILSFAHK